MRKGLQPSEYACRPTTTGCSIRDGGGEPPDTLSRLARERGGVPSTPRESAHVRAQSLPQPSSAQPTVDSGRRLARGAKRSGDLRRSTCRQTCNCPGDGVDGANVARRPPFLERGRANACRARRKKRTGSEGQRIGKGSS